MGVMMSEHEWPARRACAGDCNQGRRECTTPDACRLPESEDRDIQAGALFWPLAVVLAPLALVLLGYLVAVLP